MTRSGWEYPLARNLLRSLGDWVVQTVTRDFQATFSPKNSPFNLRSTPDQLNFLRLQRTTVFDGLWFAPPRFLSTNSIHVRSDTTDAHACFAYAASKGTWRGPSQRDEFLVRFSDPIQGSSKRASLVERRQVAPVLSGTRIADTGEGRRSQFPLNTSYDRRKKSCAAQNVKVPWSLALPV